MPNRPYTEEEKAVLAEFVGRQVPSWPEVMRRLPSRSKTSAEAHLNLRRREQGTVWTIPTGRSYARRDAR